MSDRYFDELAVRFAEKIYGGIKGDLRLAVLQADLQAILSNKPLRILDIGAGLGHISLWLANQGHAVTVTEPSETMLRQARQQFAEAGLTATFLQSPWQQLTIAEPFDLVICHAVLEWLAEPFAILPTLNQLTKSNGWLSLAFYNKDALIYRNLLKGHFKKLVKQQFAGEKNSLTPQQPIAPELLKPQLMKNWQIITESGIRMFYDYMPLDFQKKVDTAQLLTMELSYRQHPTFKGLGRYLHWVCQKKSK